MTNKTCTILKEKATEKNVYTKYRHLMQDFIHIMSLRATAH